MKLTLINPNIVVLKNDPLTTGIPFMPISLAYLAGSLRNQGYDLQIIDSFGADPFLIRTQGKFYYQGLRSNEILKRIDSESDAIILYAGILTSHSSVIEIIKSVKSTFSDIPTLVVENTQAVTAYSLKSALKEFFDAGADYVLTGECELRANILLKGISEKKANITIDGIAFWNGKEVEYTDPEGYIEDVNAMTFPAWDLFPLENYWKLGYSHGPVQGRFLPLLTSRGCPFPCRFCVVPSLNNQRWRPRSAKNVVDEMEHHVRHLNIDEFHVEDLNPTIKGRRVREMCEDILKRGLNVRWKIVAGTMIPDITDRETFQLMYDAGCRYISFSPETGSEDMFKPIGKKFDFNNGLYAVELLNSIGIKTQACFVIGFPEETDNDRNKTYEYVKQLTRKGVDEIALFIIAPVPGSAIYSQFHGFETLSQLNFTPTWRGDFSALNSFRLALYRAFLIWKIQYYPFKIIKQLINFLGRNFETKMEMVPYKALKIKSLIVRNKLIGKR